MKRIGIIVFDGVILADVITVADVFAAADRLVSALFPDTLGYSTTLLSLKGGMVTSSATMQIMTSAIAEHPQESFDTLIVASGSGNFQACQNRALVDWLRESKDRVPRIAALCTGVFALAAAGLLNGRRATTHPALQEKLAREFPSINIDRQATITEDAGIFTTGDTGMGGELTLRLLGSDLGNEVTNRIAEGLMIQRQHCNTVARPISNPVAPIENCKITIATQWLIDHISEHINIADVAAQVSMSERNFLRQFKRVTGQTPHDFLVRIRLDAVRRDLVETELPIDKIARRWGLGNGEHVAKLFRKHMSTTARDYRKNEHGTK